MTIDRAIEIFEKELESTFMGCEKDWKEAVKLGMEALILISLIRRYYWNSASTLLPGETAVRTEKEE